MLQRILDLFDEGDGTLTLRDLSRSLGVPLSALEPMVDRLVRAGLLAATDSTVTCAGSCGHTCNPRGCPFTVGLPVPLHPTSVRR
jgi:hypothetical protein